MKNCFFMDKYLCSNFGGQAASIKNADWLMCYSNSPLYTTKALGGDGCGYDAITFSRARGDHYSLTTVYQWSAMAMLSLAHGQGASSTSYCAWYDPAHNTNFPKGATAELCTLLTQTVMLLQKLVQQINLQRFPTMGNYAGLWMLQVCVISCALVQQINHRLQLD